MSSGRKDRQNLNQFVNLKDSRHGQDEEDELAREIMQVQHDGYGDEDDEIVGQEQFQDEVSDDEIMPDDGQHNFEEEDKLEDGASLQQDHYGQEGETEQSQ